MTASGRCSAPAFWSGRTSSRTRVSSTTRRVPRTGATPMVWSPPALPRATSLRWHGNSRRRRSPLPGSTRCWTCCAPTFPAGDDRLRRRADRPADAARQVHARSCTRVRSAAVAGSAHGSRAQGISQKLISRSQMRDRFKPGGTNLGEHR